MSNFEWLSGEVYLPAPALADVKRAFRSRHNEIIMDAYDKLKRFRVKNLTSSAVKWSGAITATLLPDRLTPSTRIAMAVAQGLERPRAAKWEDFEEQNWGKAGVGCTVFPLFDSDGHQAGEVTFKGRTMRWEITEGNHAVDNFMDSPDSSFLYEVLDSITWARGSGGGETYGSESEETPKIAQVFGPTGKRYAATGKSK